ncbi:MAG TPA: glutaminyl-peptide cyclotransferase [Blastocatellia bacterium]|nr:glutaminyl-peptide cyclotransferase [Blastocatellia bacterium]
MMPWLIFLLSLFIGCNSAPTVSAPPPSPEAGGRAASPAADASAPVWTYEVVNTWPHDTESYTQGLIYQDGVLYESAGQYGRSSLRKVDLQTGKVLKKVPVPGEYFAEGMTIFKSRLFQLTWTHQKGFIYNPESFQKIGEFAYTGEGWGLTHDDQSLIMSDGTNQIRFLNPDTFKVERVISVVYQGKPLTEINELEYIRGEIYANVWQTDEIIRVDPKNGKILGIIDMTGLLPGKRADETDAVLNGIAYDEKGERIFVTGKLWPKLFEVRFKTK